MLTEAPPKEALRLNVGAGPKPIPGYVSIDRKSGDEAYPLPYPDGCADEVYASHVLEHFSREEVAKVIEDWVRVLKPGGRLRVAVPNLEWIAAAVAQNLPVDIEGYIFGGQTDADDYHRSGHNERGLRILFQRAGLVGVDRFDAEYDDCSALPVSLNLCGFKPRSGAPWKTRKCALLMSMPRLAFTENMGSVVAAAGMFTAFIKSTGAFWGQCLERSMTQALDQFEWLCVVDYDTVFTPQHLERMMVLFDAHPDVDALAPLQMKRECPELLLNAGRKIPMSELDGPLFDVNTAHFGMTLFRTAALKDIPHPWFMPEPDPNGNWFSDRKDEDISFWHKFKAAGKRVCIAPRVTVGHMEMVISWPGEDFKPVYQHYTEFTRDGAPLEARR